jgi:alpha-glucoside transport system substrate-binding protein
VSRRLASALFVVALVASSCGGSETDTTSSLVVEMLVPFRGEEAASLAAWLDEFESASGISIRLTGTGSFVDDLYEQVGSADPPDIAFIPQPGVVAQLARSGDIVPLPPIALEMSQEALDSRILELGVVDGMSVAVPMRVSVKSLVWYRPEVLDELGIGVPADIDELESMAAAIQTSGESPWCFGLEAQGSTGWAATDWVEDLVLRQAGAGVYDDWLRGDVDFQAPAIANAFSTFRELVLAPGRTRGGVAGALRTPVQSVPDGLFDDEDRCVFYRQASFAVNWMPPGLEFGPQGDIDFFVLPPKTGEQPPLLIGSTVAAAFSDRPEVADVMRFLASPSGVSGWANAGGYLAAQSASLDGSSGTLDETLRRLLSEAETIRLDASDSMVPEVASGPLLQEIVRWVAGSTTYPTFAAAIDDARDEAGRESIDP